MVPGVEEWNPDRLRNCGGITEIQGGPRWRYLRSACKRVDLPSGLGTHAKLVVRTELQFIDSVYGISAYSW